MVAGAEARTPLAPRRGRDSPVPNEEAQIPHPCGVLERWLDTSGTVSYFYFALNNT